MVKGISRRVVVLDSPDQRFFEQAIFIVRNDAAGEGFPLGLFFMLQIHFFSSSAKCTSSRCFSYSYISSVAL